MRIVEKLRERYASYRMNSFKILQEIIPSLGALRRDLEYAQKTAENDPLSAIVFFFNTVSRWQDRDLWNVVLPLATKKGMARYGDIISALKELTEHLRNAGRDLYGMNRTSVGDTVTDNSVFLGNIYGLFTLPVSEWKKNKEEQKDIWNGSAWEDTNKGKNAYDVVSRQAKDFLVPQCHRMIQIITNLEREWSALKQK